MQFNQLTFSYQLPGFSQLMSVQTCVGHVPHGVLEGPDDGVQDQFELGGGDRQEGGEALTSGSLEEVEEMGPMFWEFLKVLTERRKESCKNCGHCVQTVQVRFNRPC